MSGRYSGSPPLKTRIGFPNLAIWSMISRALAVGRSWGDINSVAVARQWTHRKLQPLVTSQKINRGLNSWLAAVCALPLPSDMLALLVESTFPARLSVLNDRIPATQSAVSLITATCDVRHSEDNQKVSTAKARRHRENIKSLRRCRHPRTTYIPVPRLPRGFPAFVSPWRMTEILRSDAPGMAVSTIDAREVANIHRMFERLRLHLRQMRCTLLLIEQRVARVAVLADDLAVLADVVAIVTAETAWIEHVPDIVGMGLPIHFHVWEEGGFVDALQLGDGGIDLLGFRGCDLGILILVELGNFRGYGLEGLVLRLVIGDEGLDSLRLDKRKPDVDGAGRHSAVHREVRGSEDVRGTAVAVDAVHFAFRAAVNLRLRERAVLAHEIDNIALVVFHAHPRYDLPLLIRGDVAHVIGNVHVPVDAARRLPTTGIAPASSDQQTQLARSVLLVVAE